MASSTSDSGNYGSVSFGSSQWPMVVAIVVAVLILAAVWFKKGRV